MIPAYSRDDVGQAGQRKQSPEIATCVEKQDSAPRAPSGQLYPGKRIDRDRIRVQDAANVAGHDVGVAAVEQRTDAFAEQGDVGTCDRTADDEDDRADIDRRSPTGLRRRRRLLGSGQPGTPFVVFPGRDPFKTRNSSPSHERRRPMIPHTMTFPCARD